MGTDTPNNERSDARSSHNAVPVTRLDVDESWFRAYQAVEYRNPDTYSINGHSALMVLAEGAEKAGSFDAAEVADAIRGLGAVETTMGSLSFDAQGDLKDQKIYIYQVQAADWVQVYP